jgi:hypothetical protein
MFGGCPRLARPLDKLKNIAALFFLGHWTFLETRSKCCMENRLCCSLLIVVDFVEVSSSNFRWKRFSGLWQCPAISRSQSGESRSEHLHSMSFLT